MNNEFETMIGEVLSSIDIDTKENQILLTTKSGRIFKFYHEQDCCESVTINGLVVGDIQKLVGGVIQEITKEESTVEVEYDSRTDTTLTFKIDEHTVISNWIGESNGYYSESVDFQEIDKLGKRVYRDNNINRHSL